MCRLTDASLHSKTLAFQLPNHRPSFDDHSVGKFKFDLVNLYGNDDLNAKKYFDFLQPRSLTLFLCISQFQSILDWGIEAYSSMCQHYLHRLACQCASKTWLFNGTIFNLTELTGIRIDKFVEFGELVQQINEFEYTIHVKWQVGEKMEWKNWNTGKLQQKKSKAMKDKSFSQLRSQNGLSIYVRVILFQEGLQNLFYSTQPQRMKCKCWCTAYLIKFTIKIVALAIQATALFRHLTCDAPFFGHRFINLLRWFVVDNRV